MTMNIRSEKVIMINMLYDIQHHMVDIPIELDVNDFPKFMSLLNDLTDLCAKVKEIC